MTDCDVVVAGAGPAGLSAAKAARGVGLSAIVVEAKSRIGGRAFTERTTLGEVFDYGAHFLHLASRNPLREYAKTNGFAYKTGGYTMQIHDGKWYCTLEQAAFLTETKNALKQIADGSDDANQRSSADALAYTDVLSPARTSLFHGYYEELLGASATQVAAAEHARYVDTFEDWPVEAGYGTLIAHFGADVPVVVDCPVREIDHTGKHVLVRTPRGTIRARSVIVTVSTGVLAVGQIRFTPPLPHEKQRAIDGVPMGYAGKVGFRLQGNMLRDVPTHHGIINRTDGFFANLHIRPFEKPLAIAIVGGPHWEMLERAGPDAMVDMARTLIRDLYGADAQRDLGRSLATNWLSDPHVLGGHSFMRHGYGLARQTLAAPIEDRVFFAGEATSLDSWATVHGAYASGIRAINEVKQALGNSAM